MRCYIPTCKRIHANIVTCIETQEASWKELPPAGGAVDHLQCIFDRRKLRGPPEKRSTGVVNLKISGKTGSVSCVFADCKVLISQKSRISLVVFE